MQVCDTRYSEKIKPPRVKESPISFECKVLEVKPMGTEGGAGNLVICEVLLAHVDDQYLDDDKKIMPTALDLVARMGGSWYTRTNKESMFEIPKPLSTKGIGFDQLPRSVLNSTVLTGNNLGRLANVEKLPSKSTITAFSEEAAIAKLLSSKDQNHDQLSSTFHQMAKEYLDSGNIEKAWCALLVT